MADDTKRRAIFKFCRDRADIICLQETHSNVKSEKIWTSEWGGKCFFSHGETNARGVMTLLKKDCNVKVVNQKRDTDGRLLILEINENGNIFVICNLYGPNRDCPKFVMQVSKLLEEVSEHKIVLGDFNVTLEPMDRYKNGLDSKKAMKEAVVQLMEEYSLIDVWRNRNPSTLHFSWQRRKPQRQASRIDYTLTSQGLESYVQNVIYIPAIMTDHQAMFLAINFSKKERGCGYWKMNCSMLSNLEFVEKINQIIDDTIRENKLSHPCFTWEKVKSNVAKEAKKFCRRAKSEKQVAISQLLEKVGELEETIELTKQEEDILLKSKIELDRLCEEQARSLQFRCKVRWMEYGEKSSRYFYSLEKTRYNSKTCHNLIHQGIEITSDEQILEIEKNFYQELYKQDPEVKFQLENTYNVRVSEQHKLEQNKELELEEIASAIKELSNNKTPGQDGLPIEFYKVFFNKIAQLLHQVYIVNYEEEEMHQTSMKGILNLIPKPGKDSRDINNLRPITLLNVDYKIIEKVLANRMRNAMQEIIHTDQKGFLPGRRISCNIRKILDLIFHAEQEKLDAFILSLDYKKCFDMISFDAIIGSLDFFEFPDFIKKWTRILYTGYEVKVQNNGKFSEAISIERSVHQGGVNSVNYFLLVAEILALKLRDDYRIKGIPVKEIINLLGQFADDMDMYLLADQTSLNCVFQHISDFHYHSGFTVNYEKTKILRIGALKDTDAQLITQREVAWTNEPINVLGVWVGNQEKRILEMNYTKIIQKAKATLKVWRHRDLSLIGKVNVVNTLVGSLFVYKMTVLPNMPRTLIEEMKKEIRSFIWNGKKAKIALKTLQGSIDTGGLRLVNLRLKEVALKISWIQILEQDEAMAEMAFRSINPYLKTWVFECNLSKKDVKFLNIENTFWRDVMEAWCYYHYTENIDQNQCIWYNSLIRVQGQPIFWKNCFSNGLFRVSQLYKGDELISFREAQEFNLNFVEFHTLVTAIPKELKRIVQKEVRWESKYAQLLDCTHITRTIYTDLISRSDNISYRSKNKWEEELNIVWSNKDFCREVKDIYRVTNITKYRSFQYRLLHRALVLNTHLKVWKMRDDSKCTFCESEDETLLHLFVYCQHVQQLWWGIYQYFKLQNMEQLQLNAKGIIMNKIHPKPGHVTNMICLVTKQYIYRKKCANQKPKMIELKAQIFSIENQEKYIAQKNGKIGKHYAKWNFGGDQNNTMEDSIEDYVDRYLEQL